MTSFSGFIMASPAPRDFSPRDFEMETPAFPKGASLALSQSRTFGMPRWDEFVLTSSIPLSEGGDESGPFKYPLFIVRGYSKLLVLAHRRRIVDHAISQVFNNKVYPNIRKVPLLIDPMIGHCSLPSAEFLITSLHGKYSGPDTHLRSISLYGDDVAKSLVFSEHHELFNFHTCGLGRRLYDGLPKTTPGEDGEILRAASDGFVSLKLTSRSQATEIQAVIDYIMVHRWVEDWVPEGKGDTQ